MMGTPRTLLCDALSVLHKEGLVNLLRSSVNHINLKIAQYTFSNFGFGWEYLKRQYCVRSPNETDANPFKILWVDPNKIKYGSGKLQHRSDPSEFHLHNFSHNFRREDNKSSFGAVESGDWDIKPDEFKKMWEYKGIEEWYVHDVDWQNTAFFETHLQAIRNEGYAYGARSYDELLLQCKRYSKLLNKIKKKGYRTQRELQRPKPSGEIRVNIGRDGKMMFNNCGRHRLSIAKVLNIDAIPVVVEVRHRKWQKVRNKIANNNHNHLNENLLSHPDLQDIYCSVE